MTLKVSKKAPILSDVKLKMGYALDKAFLLVGINNATLEYPIVLFYSRKSIVERALANAREAQRAAIARLPRTGKTSI